MFVRGALRPGETVVPADEANGSVARSPIVLALAAGFALIFINEREAVGAIIEQIMSESGLIAVLPVLAPAAVRILLASRGSAGSAVPS